MNRIGLFALEIRRQALNRRFLILLAISLAGMCAQFGFAYASALLGYGFIRGFDYARSALTAFLGYVFPIFLALESAEAFGGDYRTGMIRALLLEGVGRERLGLSKIAAIIVKTVTVYGVSFVLVVAFASVLGIRQCAIEDGILVRSEIVRRMAVFAIQQSLFSVLISLLSACLAMVLRGRAFESGFAAVLIFIALKAIGSAGDPGALSLAALSAGRLLEDIDASGEVSLAASRGTALLAVPAGLSGIGLIMAFRKVDIAGGRH